MSIVRIQDENRAAEIIEAFKPLSQMGTTTRSTASDVLEVVDVLERTLDRMVELGQGDEVTRGALQGCVNALR